MNLSPSDLLTVIAIAKKEAERVIPDFRQPSDGKDGDNGKDGKDGLDGRDGFDGVNGQDGKNGLDGRDGLDGLNGNDGRDGIDGKDGANGADGIHGRDGKDGVGVSQAAVADDGRLYIGLTNGEIIDAGKVRGEDGKDGKSASKIVVSGGIGGGSSASAQETFETVSKNLKASPATFSHGVDGLETVTYGNGIVKTLAYSPSGLSSVTLSGNTPGGISLIKSFTYSGGNLTGFNYS